MIAIPCFSAHAAERTYATRNFNAVRATGDMQIVIRTGPSHSVKAEGDAAMLRRLAVRNNGDVLTITLRPQSRLEKEADLAQQPPHILVTLPAITDVTMNGNGTLALDRLSGNRRTDRAKISIFGTGSMQIQHIMADNVLINASGRSQLTLGGRARQANVVLLGDGVEVMAGALELGQLRITAEGALSAQFSVDRLASGIISKGTRLVVSGASKCNIATPDIDEATTQLLCESDE